MLRQECIYCKQSCTRNFVCESCENELILSCHKTEKYLKFKGKLIKLTYFWSFNNLARKSIISGKYKFNKQVFISLADIAFCHYGHEFDFEGCTVTYVPTTYLRYCFRGFNQSKIICQKFCKNPKKILKRTKYLASQIKNDQFSRWKKERQFKVIAKIEQSAKIVIFDDVCTTGATLLMCAEEILRSNPDCQIEFVTLAFRKRYLYLKD